jgi:hypothetical protein
MAKVKKAETRACVLRKLIEKAMTLQKKLHQQHERYLVHWPNPRTPFLSDFMQIEGAADTSKGCSAVVQYCLQPLVQKLIGDHVSNCELVVIVRAVVMVEE